MLNVESLTNSDNSTEYFRRLNVDSNKRELQAAPAKAGAKPKNNSVKPNVTVQTKVGKPVVSKKQTKDQKAAAKVVMKKQQAALKKSTFLSQKKNLKKNLRLVEDKKKLRTTLKVTRAAMRAERKNRDDAKLKKDAPTFVASKAKVLGLKQKIRATKANFKQVVVEMKNTIATIKDNRSTLEKITGKKQMPVQRRPHDSNRKAEAMATINRRSSKIFALESRMARAISYLRFAKKSKDTMSSVYMKQLEKRAHRLATRLHRKHKDLMRILIRKIRVNKHFKSIYKRHAKKALALAKADEPKTMTAQSRIQVHQLKKKMLELMESHTKLTGEKQKMRIKVRVARAQIADRKQTKKLAKTKLKAQSKKAVKTKNDVKSLKEAEKMANERRFKLHLARLHRKANKEHRHNLREQDRKVIGQVKAIQASIFKLSGERVKRPNLASTTPAWRLNEIQKKKAAKVVRSQKKLAINLKKLAHARLSGDVKNSIKFDRRVKKFQVQITKRGARLEHFRQKKLRNKDVKAKKDFQKKTDKKQNKFAAKKTYITKRVTTHRKKNDKKQAIKNNRDAARKANSNTSAKVVVKKTAKVVKPKAKVVVKPKAKVAAKPKATVKVAVKPKATVEKEVKAPVIKISKPKVTAIAKPAKSPKRKEEEKKRTEIDIGGLDDIIKHQQNKSANYAKKLTDDIPTA